MVMYAKRRFSRFPRRFVRTKRNGAWVGTVVTSATLTAGTSSSWYLWDDLTSQRLNLGGKGTHQRTLLWLMPYPNEPTTIGMLGWQVNTYQTDAANNVPLSSIVSPFDQALMEKSPLNIGFRAYVNGLSVVGTSQFAHLAAIEQDIRVKRKLDDTDALLLTVQLNAAWGITAPTTLRFGFVARTYVSW